MSTLPPDYNGGLASRDPEERRRATSELAGFDPESVATLVAVALADEDWRVRKEAVAVALVMAPSPVMLERLVAAFMPSENVGLRNAAVEALGGYGEAAVRALSEKMKDFDADGRKLAVDALARGGQPRALPVLASLVDDEDPNVRIAVAEAVASIGMAGVSEAGPLLERCVSSGEPLIALAALEGMNALGMTVPWDIVASCLRVPTLRRAALLAAGRGADPRAVPVIIEALRSARGAAFGDAVCALREAVREPAALQRVRELAETLGADVERRLLELAADEDGREAVRRAALVVVAALGLEGAADCAVVALGDDRVLSEAHDALELLGASAAQALVSAARGGDSVARASCLSLLSRFDRPPDGAVAAARDALGDVSAEVQCEALAVLSRFGDESCIADVGRALDPEAGVSVSKAAEGALQKLALRHRAAARALSAGARPDGPEAHAACVIIAALGLADPRDVESALAFLSAALSNPAEAVRRAALDALAEVGHSRGVDSVAFALTDEELGVRRVAIAALGRIRAEDGSAPGVPHLVDLIQSSQDSELVAVAVRALGEAGDAHVVSVLRPLTRAERPIVAVSAVEALAQLSGPKRIDALLEGLLHEDAEVVKATMLALSEAPDPRVVAHLGACLDHEAWDVRRLAADLLGRVSGDAALGLLRARLAAEDSPPVQAAISRALERAAGIRRSLPPGSLRPR
jgi:HEAT repeat protein